MKNFKPKIAIFLFILFSFSLPIFLFEKNVLADNSLEEIKGKIEERNKKLKELENQAETFRQKLKSSRVFAQSLKKQLEKDTLYQKSLKNSLLITQERISILELEIEKINLEINKLEEKIEKKKERIKEIIERLYENDQINLLEILLSQKNLTGILNETQNLVSLENSLNEELEEIKEQKKEISQRKENLQAKKDEEKIATDNYQAKLQVAEQEIKNRKELLKRTKSKEKNYQLLLKKIEKERIAIAREIDELEEELRKKINLKALPEPFKGILDWPARGELTQGYGRTAFALKHYHSRFHNGIDIALNIGTPLKAAAKGKVIALGNQDRYCWHGAYGKFVALKHPNNLVTLYAHLSLIKVKIGQEVKRGEVIGYSGNTGYSTGPHLHFGVYDASTFLIKESKFCGPMPVGGSLNPLDYLK